MSWFSKKQPKPTDDALVEQTLAFVQEVSREELQDAEPQEAQTLERLIAHIQVLPKTPAPEEDLQNAVMPPVMQAADAVIAAATPPEPASVPALPRARPAAPPALRAIAELAAAETRPPPSKPQNAPLPAKSTSPPSELRREVAQRVQSFRAHQQRLNDEREARIRQVYANMQARLRRGESSGSSAP